MGGQNLTMVRHHSKLIRMGANSSDRNPAESTYRAQMNEDRAHLGETSRAQHRICPDDWTDSDAGEVVDKSAVQGRG